MIHFLETSEATYIYDTFGGYHLYINCICGGKNGRYSGSHYKNSNKIFDVIVDNYVPSWSKKYDHTFSLNEYLLLQELLSSHKEEDKNPLIIICNDCKREFSFTHESYLSLVKKILDYKKSEETVKNISSSMK